MTIATLSKTARVLSCVFAAGALLPLAPVVHAQNYPVKPVRVISAYAAGGTNELAARPIINYLSATLGQQFLLEAKPGANGNIGAMEVVRAAPDGYTLLFNTSSQVTINPALYKMPFDPVKDLTPITMVSANSLGLIVSTSVRLRISRSSLPMPRPIRASSPILRRAMAASTTCRVNCSPCRPRPACCTCPMAAVGRP
jgi:hypothetical protein